MQKVVECTLVVNSEINGRSDRVVINGKGYYKDDNNEIVVYFSSDDTKYKYIYKDNKLEINCNESCYVFEQSNKNIGKIKSEDYVFEVITYANKIEVYNNLIIVEYDLYQQDILIGHYNCELFF